MPDICTLVSVVTMTLAMCSSPPACRKSEDGTKMLCVEGSTICPSPEPVYVCKRQDGSSYTVPVSKVK